MEKVSKFKFRINKIYYFLFRERFNKKIDFNFKKNKQITREGTNRYIFTGAQIINRSIFEGINKKVFSMNLVWDKMIEEKILLGEESNQTFFHINNFNVYEELNKLKFID